MKTGILDKTSSLQKGNTEFREGRYIKSIAHYEEALQRYPQLHNVITANIALAKAKIKEAVRPEFIKSNPTDIAVAWVHNSRDLMTHKYRVHNYEKHLANRQIVSVVILEDDLSATDLSDIDILVLCRIDANELLLDKVGKFRSSGKPVVFDIDDLVFDPDLVLNIRHIASRDDAYRIRLQNMFARLKRTMLACDYATVSTFALKKEVERFGIPAYIIPNNIPDEEVERAETLVQLGLKKRNLHTRIGYFSGTATHEYDFMECSDALYEIMEENDQTQFMIIGHLDAVSQFKKFGNRFIQLAIMPHEKMLEYLATVHINLAPLEYKNRFTQGKSELKIFEAALFGIPTIASPTASYGALIRNGFNGFLAYNKEDWKTALSRMIVDSSNRRKIGCNAKTTIADRYLIKNTLSEYDVLLKSVKYNTLRLPSIRTYPAFNATVPSVSIVSILYKKEREVWWFLESLRRQDFELRYEIILIDDCCPGETVKIVNDFVDKIIPLPDSNKLMSVRLVKNTENKGNCFSRNRGIDEAKGDIIVIVDADCMLDCGYLSSHYKAHLSGMCDVVIGPKGIETNNRPPMSVLNIYNIDTARAVQDANPQDGVNQDSFVNCVTRNLSINRSILCNLGAQVFDELFSYSRSPESGFGWEDVELGARLYQLGARIKYLDNTASIHISHPPAVDNNDKPVRSLKNFRRLHEKHSFLKTVSHAWSTRTFNAITTWCDKAKQDVSDNADYLYLKNAFESVSKWPTFVKQAKQLKILTYRWHCPHQYELYRSGHEFTLVTGLGTALTEDWDWSSRPLPANAQFKNIHDINVEEYDLAILHFDENVLCPSNSYNPDKAKQMVPDDWGAAFIAALSWNLPKIAICHGTPQFYGQYDRNYTQDNLGDVIEGQRTILVEALKNITVVCNSYQAQEEWSFYNSKVIWQGFAPHEYLPVKTPGECKILTMSKEAIENRPHYNGYFVMNDISLALGERYPMGNLHVLSPPHTYIPRTNEWAKVKYENYTRELARHSVYVNPTVRSPMPRTRGEAMMAGLVSVSLRNHDVDMFIDNGVDGFYADSSAEMAEQIKFLAANDTFRFEMAVKSRRKAIDVFNQHRYLSTWENLISEVL